MVPGHTRVEARRLTERQRLLNQRLIDREFALRGLVPVRRAAEMMRISPGRLQRLIKQHKVEFVLFPWRGTQILGIPVRNIHGRVH